MNKQKLAILLALTVSITNCSTSIALADTLYSFETDINNTIDSSFVVVSYPHSNIRIDYEIEEEGYSDDVIQQAIDETSSKGGGVVYIAEGTYKIKKEIQLKSNVTLYMTEDTILQIPDQVIEKISSISDDEIYVNNASMFTTGESVGIVNGNSEGYKNGEVVKIIDIKNNRIKINKSLENSYSDGYLISHYSAINVNENTENVAVIGGELDLGEDSNRIKISIINADATFNGISMYPGNKNVLIKDVKIHGARFRGIHMWGEQKNVLADNCEISNCKSDGFIVDTVYKNIRFNNSNVSVSNCKIYNNGGNGIFSTGINNFNIYNNHISNNDGGIYLANYNGMYKNTHTNISISDNIIEDNNLGIQINQTNGTVISNNTIRSAEEGIGIYNYSDCTLIENNTIDNVEKGIIEKNSDNTLLKNNDISASDKEIILSGSNSIKNNTVNKVNYTGPVNLILKGHTATNLLNDNGNIKAEHNIYGQHGNLLVWTNNLSKLVDGTQALDCKFSDYEYNPMYPTLARCNTLKFPSINGHKYFVTLKAKGKMSIEKVNTDSGVIEDTISSNNSEWNNLSYIAEGDGNNLMFLLRSEYVTEDAGYVRDIQVFDITESGHESESKENLESLYCKSYINGTESVTNPNIIVNSTDTKKCDLLNNSGMLEDKDYNTYGMYGNLYIWGGNENHAMPKVDGYNVLDGMWNDYEWITRVDNLKNPRSNFIRFNTIKDQKYCVTAKVKGHTTLELINPKDGKTITSKECNNNDWSTSTIILNGTGMEMIVLLKSDYKEFNAGYFRDIQAFNLTARNQEDLSEDEVENYYSNESNVFDTSINSNINFNCKLKNIYDYADTIKQGKFIKYIDSKQISASSYDDIETLNNVAVLKFSRSKLEGIKVDDLETILVENTNRIDFNSNYDKQENIGNYYLDSMGNIGLIIPKPDVQELNATIASIGSLNIDYVLDTPIETNYEQSTTVQVYENITFDVVSGLKPFISIDSNSFSGRSSNTFRIDIDGEDNIILDNRNHYSTQYTYSVKNGTGNVIIDNDISWEVSGDSSGVSIDNNGMLRVNKDDIQEKTILLIARSNKNNEVIGMKAVRITTPSEFNLNIPNFRLQTLEELIELINRKVNELRITNNTTDASIELEFKKLITNNKLNVKVTNYHVDLPSETTSGQAEWVTTVSDLRREVELNHSKYLEMLDSEEDNNEEDNDEDNSKDENNDNDKDKDENQGNKNDNKYDNTDSNSISSKKRKKKYFQGSEISPKSISNEADKAFKTIQEKGLLYAEPKIDAYDNNVIELVAVGKKEYLGTFIYTREEVDRVDLNYSNNSYLYKYIPEIDKFVFIDGEEIDRNTILCKFDKDSVYYVTNHQINENLIVKPGAININNDIYYLENTLILRKGFYFNNGEYYYYNSTNGKMAVDWTEIDAKKYKFNSNGVMQTGWYYDEIRSSWYFFDLSGILKTGWIHIDKNWYYLDSDGRLVTNTYINGYYLDSTGKWV